MELLSCILFAINFPGSSFIPSFLEVMLWRVNPVQRAVVPHHVVAAFVAVYPFLFTAFRAVDSPETIFDFHLFFFGFLLSPASCASEGSTVVLCCVMLFSFFSSR